MGIIILEGCDASGKDTFGLRLADELGYEMVRGSSFEISELGADGMFEYMSELLDRDNIVINRFMHSNLVYGALFDYPMMSHEQYDKLTKKINEVALPIYLYSEPHVIKERLSSRGDDMVKASYVDSILRAYSHEWVGKYSTVRLLAIDTEYSDMSYQREVNRVKDILYGDA